MDALKQYKAAKKKHFTTFLIPASLGAILTGVGLWMFFANVGGRRGPNYRGEYWTLGDFMGDPFSFFPGLLVDAGLILLVCAVAWFVWISCKDKSNYEYAHTRELREKAARDAKQRRIEMVTNDTWNFPVKEFYEKCTAQGIVDSDTAFTRKKIENVAKNLMLEMGIPVEVQGRYLQRAVKYFDAENNRIISKIAEEDKCWKTTLHIATPSADDESALKIAEQAQTLYGIEKRKAMLLTSLESVRYSLAQSEGSSFNPILQREKDWAVHGGIAEGIAGPAAGVATALNVMRENEKIREQNDQMLAFAAMANYKRSEREARYKKEISRLEEELRVLPEKVIFDDIGIPEIFSAFKVSLLEISRVAEHDESCMKVRLSFQQVKSLHLDIPADVRIVLDGAVSGKVYTAKEQSESVCPGGVEVGTFIAPLELYGIPYINALEDGKIGNVFEIVGLCNSFYGDINTKYTCNLTRNQNLWLMER